MRVAVVGAGIAGLAAAYEAHLIDPAAEITVYEGSDRIGGKLAVSEVAGVPVDAGAETFLVRVPEAAELAAALGFDLVHPRTTAAAVVAGGTAYPMPAGTVMGVPADGESVRDLLGPGAARTVDAEPDRPGEPLHEDVAVGEYVGARLGRAVVDRLVDPLLGGVYAGRADELSMRATVPQLYKALSTTGSVVEAVRSLAAAPSGKPVFGALATGLGSLPQAVLAASGAALKLGLPVREITRTQEGFRLTAGPVPSPTYAEADAVVVAAPAAKAGPMLSAVAPEAARELAAIEYASIGIVTLAYARDDVPAGDRSGLLVPAVEGRTLKAVTFSSRKWAHLDGDTAVLRASVGRFRDPGALQRDDAELVQLVRDDLEKLARITAAPVDSRVTRWGGGLPQYAVGHLDRVARIRAAVEKVPGLAVAGAAYEGVGVPACIRTGRAAARRVMARSGHG